MVLECINCCNRFHTKHINGISRRKLFIKYFEGKVKNYLWNECCQYHFIDPGNFCDNIIEERYKYCLTHKSVLFNTPELILQDKYFDFFKNIIYPINETELLEQWSKDFLLEYSYKDSHDKLLICTKCTRMLRCEVCEEEYEFDKYFDRFNNDNDYIFEIIYIKNGKFIIVCPDCEKMNLRFSPGKRVYRFSCEIKNIINYSIITPSLSTIKSTVIPGDKGLPIINLRNIFWEKYVPKMDYNKFLIWEMLGDSYFIISKEYSNIFLILRKPWTILSYWNGLQITKCGFEIISSYSAVDIIMHEYKPILPNIPYVNMRFKLTKRSKKILNNLNIPADVLSIIFKYCELSFFEYSRLSLGISNDSFFL